MYIAEILFEFIGKDDNEESIDKINHLLSALSMNGQILGREFPIAHTEKGYIAYVMTPEYDSLDEAHANKYVKYHLERLSEFNLKPPRTEVIGPDHSGDDACTCGKHDFFILYTTYLCLESPLNCGNCFSSIPLYRIPPTDSDEYHDILCWESDYQSCDSLQMNCSTGIRFGTREISDYNSSLTKRGLSICKKIFDSTGVPTYYYLYRGGGRSMKSERLRRCPSCGKNWLLREPLHGKFDFKCDRCHLLSNIGLSVRN